MNIVFLIGGLLLILWGANALTDGASSVAKRFNIPDIVIGLTIVAFGTSAPELTVSVSSALKGSADMAIGNVVGSNIFNIFAVLGVCAIFAPVVFTRSNVRRDIPVCILASMALLAVTAFNEDITRFEGALLLVGYVVMIVLMIRSDRKTIATAPAAEAVENPAPKMATWRIAVWIIAGLGGLIYGGNLCVDSATEIARQLGVSEATIAITLVAGGTSLPELASSLVSIFKGRASLALGNVLGSNIANILLILGACSTITPLTMGNVKMFDIYVAVAGVVLLLLSAYVIGRDKITRFEGLLFLGCYVAYLYVLL